jgi:molybdenum cofactor cytidylyltransferase
MNKYNIPIIILAAGSSSRLGKPKQLLEYNNETLLNRTIRIANIITDKIVVVLGSNAELIQATIENKAVQIVINSDWPLGMASSIKAGIISYLNTDAIIICLCDQPFLSENVFKDLIDKKEETQKPIIASKYSEILGVPILFDKTVFNDLMQLEGDKGAKAILNKNLENVASISFEKGNIDIDTIDEWNNFLESK